MPAFPFFCILETDRDYLIITILSGFSNPGAVIRQKHTPVAAVCTMRHRLIESSRLQFLSREPPQGPESPASELERR